MTSNPKRRFKDHLSKNSTCTKIKHAIQKHGKENFVFEVICVGSEEYIIELEEKAIIAYNSIEHGYNLVLGNPKTGAMCLSEEMKQKISDGLNKFYSENIPWNRGIKLGRRKKYDPHYVSGFWFPHLEDASKALGRGMNQLRRWRKDGTLGDVQRLSKDSLEKPIYVGGFWFDTLSNACSALGQERMTLIKRVKDGAVEEKFRKRGNSGEDNHMKGRTGFLHHNSRAVEVDGVIYGSVAEAIRSTEYTKKILYNRLKSNSANIRYVDSEELI
jgi:hypothetical protein